MTDATPVGGRLSSRARLAKFATVTTSRLTRALRLGDGSTLGGRFGLALSPTLLSKLGSGRIVILVSGTNGKTTTTRLLVEALGGAEKVANSASGANMPAGMTAALAERPTALFAALEVDERYLGQATRALGPSVIVLLNLSRDQLDRMSEVRSLAQRWQTVLAETPATVVANADDPLVVFAARASSRVIWVGAGALWNLDARHCPECGSEITFASPEDWACRSCDLRRPEPDVTFDGELLRLSDGRRFPLSIELPGRFNLANAAMAVTAANACGVELSEALRRVADLGEIAGRFRRVDLGGVVARLLLAKNPAGWVELLELVRGDARPIVIAINAKIADGRDPSWLWDVPFEMLRGRYVVASGDRSLDLSVRLRHAGVAHDRSSSQLGAITLAGAPEVDYIGNYTAFQELRRSLRRAPLGLTTVVAPPVPDESVPVVEELSSREDAPGAVVQKSTSHESAIRIVIVHPDLLGTYGDAGNGRVLANRALWRGFDVELVLARSDRDLPEHGDIYCLGGGEDGPQLRSAERLRASHLARRSRDGAVIFAVCAGYQIIGESFPGESGVLHAGLSLLDVRTERYEGPRSVGEVVVQGEPLLLGGSLGELSGFENHQSHTMLGADVSPLGRVVRGIGNDGRGSDGAVDGRIIGTYMHGPVLARNATLADAVLRLVIGSELAALEDGEEQLLHRARLEAASRGRRVRLHGSRRPRKVVSR